MLLWLSHLMLAPFELATISTRDEQVRNVVEPGEFADLPGVARDLISLALQHLKGAGKEREAASMLLVRLSLRNDMQAHDLARRLVAYANQQLLSGSKSVSINPYQPLGSLSFLYGITNSGADSEVAPYLPTLFSTTTRIATDQSGHFSTIRDTAPARKWMLKILRAVLTHAISLNSRHHMNQPDQVDTMLEESIQYFLDALGDKDTPVRMAAAKGLSVITLKLDSAMSTEVVEAVLGCLQENVLLEDPHSQRLVAITDRLSSDISGMQRNISSVDPLRWHGLMLTLAHLLFRRSPPPDMLSEIIQALILGLEFEQRSNVGTSLGVGVRDAACFGMWALARKYSSSELDLVPVAEFAESSRNEYLACKSVLQLIATKLVISACLDPSGNIRRGSSAALQELIGRHPDTVVNGIALVQAVDYQAVARLSRAMTEVASHAATLDIVYRGPLLQALTEWRGARAADVNQRRWAAKAIQTLTKSVTVSEAPLLAKAIHGQILNLRPMNVGTTAAVRHGLLLGFASSLQPLTRSTTSSTPAWLMQDKSPILDIKRLAGKIEGRTTPDIELVMEAVAVLVLEICKCFEGTICTSPAMQEWLPTAVDLLGHCTVAGTREIVVQSSAEAFVEVFKLSPDAVGISAIEQWLNSKRQSPSAYASKGRLKAISLVCNHLAVQGLDSATRQKTMSYVFDIIEGGYKIETKVDAMEALGVILSHESMSEGKEARTRLSHVLRHGLTDYTNDQRGDIGSLLRQQTLETVEAYSNHCSHSTWKIEVLRDVMPLVVKLAAEKLNNVRFRAWRCLGGYWQCDSSLPDLRNIWHFPNDVSSTVYFQQLMQLLSVPWAQRQLILGLISSATSGTEDICRAANTAFLLYVQSLQVVQGKDLVTAIWAVVVEELASNTAADDRQIVPLLDFLCFMIDQDLVSSELFAPADSAQLDLWTIMQSIHGPSSTLQRIETSLNVYSRLMQTDGYRSHALDKLTRQLLHRWPKVRRCHSHHSHADNTFCRSGTMLLTFSILIAQISCWRQPTGTPRLPKRSPWCWVFASSSAWSVTRPPSHSDSIS